MYYSPENAATVLRLVDDFVGKDEPAQTRLSQLWSVLLLSRSRTLAGSVRQIVGNKVYGGPFKDMILTDAAIDLYHTPILLGCYEHELHPTFEKVIAADYDCILNIGCSVGYYAIGLARRMPHAVIDAFDIDPEARQKCADMARANGVEDRVHISGQFYGDGFSKYANRKTLVLVDIEGAEKDLLDPACFPALQKMDVIVELHDLMDSAISKTVCDRFAVSHTVKMIQNRAMLPDVCGLLSPDSYLDPFDHLLLGWEGRDGPTPWGVFMKKQ